jgi:hypothetical protein
MFTRLITEEYELSGSFGSMKGATAMETKGRTSLVEIGSMLICKALDGPIQMVVCE